MENKKEYLTEENYQKGVTLLKRLAFIVFIVGFIIGGTLITVGYIKTSEIKRQNEKAVSESNKSVKAKNVTKGIKEGLESDKKSK